MKVLFSSSEFCEILSSTLAVKGLLAAFYTCSVYEVSVCSGWQTQIVVHICVYMYIVVSKCIYSVCL